MGYLLLPALSAEDTLGLMQEQVPGSLAGCAGRDKPERYKKPHEPTTPHV